MVELQPLDKICTATMAGDGGSEDAAAGVSFQIPCEFEIED